MSVRSAAVSLLFALTIPLQPQAGEPDVVADVSELVGIDECQLPPAAGQTCRCTPIMAAT